MNEEKELFPDLPAEEAAPVDLSDLDELAKLAGLTDESGEAILHVDRAEAAKIIEACLFAAGHPLAVSRLSDLLSMTPKEVRALAEEMMPNYEDRGIQLLLLEDSLQLVTKEEYREYIRAALGIRRGGNLSRSSLETIAIIAYNQPVTRGYVDEVRGVDSSYAINSLLEKGLIEPKGRLDVPGRPILYGTTAEFLMVFGLSSLTQLPSADLFLHSDDPEQLSLPIDGENPLNKDAEDGIAADAGTVVGEGLFAEDDAAADLFAEPSSDAE